MMVEDSADDVVETALFLGSRYCCTVVRVVAKRLPVVAYPRAATGDVLRTVGNLP